jgi:hypothetical protein
MRVRVRARRHSCEPPPTTPQVVSPRPVSGYAAKAPPRDRSRRLDAHASRTREGRAATAPVSPVLTAAIAEPSGRLATRWVASPPRRPIRSPDAPLARRSEAGRTQKPGDQSSPSSRARSTGTGRPPSLDEPEGHAQRDTPAYGSDCSSPRPRCRRSRGSSGASVRTASGGDDRIHVNARVVPPLSLETSGWPTAVAQVHCRSRSIVAR